ncbi:MAG: hypothetical protein M3400_09310 [Actinomycetota bacterium]|nr:hypothetical protein [Actinomycetota bacterium]
MSDGDPDGRTTGVAEPRSAAFNVLVGLTTLAVLLQGLWAGIFLQDADEVWVNVHGAGAYVTAILALAATIVAVVRLRPRTDLVVASVVLTLLILIETGLGVAVRGGTRGLTVIHVPLALLIMGMAVWLPLKARNAR